jgi:hypothetical protein
MSEPISEASVHNEDRRAVELLPCPFCGKEAHLVDEIIYTVECDECRLSLGYSEELDHILSIWNSRKFSIEDEKIKKRMGKALKIIREYGTIEDIDQKQWALDQVARCLLDDMYLLWVDDEWDTGTQFKET